MNKNLSAIKDILDETLDHINFESFFTDDPILIPHQYHLKQDQEIAGFIAAILAWGQRKTIIRNTTDFLARMDNAPYDFIKNAKADELKVFSNFKHRTFNEYDAKCFIQALQHIYHHYDSMEDLFEGKTIYDKIIHFRRFFISSDDFLKRTEKHVANPAKKSTAKRLNMYLRWMVRKGAPDLGIWTKISPSILMCPLDVHVRNSALELKLLKRTQSDWQAVEELSSNLRKMDAKDPIKYDLALFMMGVEKNKLDNNQLTSGS
jgi:uncharacterized protein (TIGR02757 family)